MFDLRTTSTYYRKARAWIAALVLWLSLLLVACGAPTPTPPLTPLANVPVTENRAPTSIPTTAPTIAPATPATNTGSTKPTVTDAPTFLPTTAPAPTTTPLAASPTASGTVAAIDRTYERELIKQGYDFIHNHFFKEPDTAAMITTGLKAASDSLGVAVPETAPGNNADANWAAFSKAFDGMVQASARKTAKGDLAHRVIDAFATSVNDLHTYVISADEYKAEKAQQRGDYTTVGFGITVIFDDKDSKPILQRVLTGSPAEQAGLHAGDKVLTFNGKDINKDNWRTTVKLAPEGGQGVFVVERIGAGQVTITATKKQYTLVSVESRVLNGHIGYIIIHNFLTNVTTEFDRALKDLRDKGVDSWIVDVRDDPGGYQYANIAARFVPPGSTIGYTVNRTGRKEVKADAGNVKDLPSQPKLPLVVLLNDSSYSSSEIFSMAVRDYKLGTLIGTRSGGALGETLPYELRDGWAIYVTLDEYEGKNGDKYNNIGVPPDIEVKNTTDDLANNRDPQLDTAITQVSRMAQK